MQRFKEHYRLSAKPSGPVFDKLVSDYLKPKGFVGPDIMRLWQRIVDPSLAGQSYPVKFSYAPKTSSHRATLTVKCSDGAHLMLSYQKNQLINLLNQNLGYDAIEAIKFVKTPGISSHETENPKAGDRDALPTARMKTIPTLDEALDKLAALPKKYV